MSDTPKPIPLKLFKKLLEVRKSVDYLQKSTQGSQFNYTSSSQVLAAVRQKMNDLGLLIVPNVTNGDVASHANSKGVMVHFTEVDMIMTWVDTESGETLDVPWYGQGVDLAGEKGVGKALTYAEKYFILKSFNIPTDKDDPDAFQEKNISASALEEEKQKAISEMEAAKSTDEATLIWNKYPNLKRDGDFKRATADVGKRLKEKEKGDA